MSKTWDVFVSYASEDKAFARSLASRLRDAQLNVWFDEFELRLGDSLRERIDHGLASCRFGVVIVSDRFLSKKWPQRELNAMFVREDGLGKLILPVLHGVTPESLAQSSPILADRLAVSSDSGLDTVTVQVLRAVRPHLDNTQWEPFAFEWKHGITLVVLPIGDPDWAICLAKHPITNSQYAIFVKQDSWGGEPEGESLVDGKWQAGFRPWRHSDFSGADKPVVCVSYNEAVMFTTWLEWYSGSAPRDSSVRIGDCDARIFIPSAQLWEFAAYGAWSRPSDIAPRIAELQAVHHRTNAPANTGGQTERANHLGLVDMFGNVWEWCADVGRYRAPLFQSGLYDADAIPDLRGGGFKDDVFQTDIFISAAILEAPAETKHFDIGFRVGAAVPLAGVPDRVRASLAECDQRTENIALGVGLRVSPLGPR